MHTLAQKPVVQISVLMWCMLNVYLCNLKIAREGHSLSSPSNSL